jgi:hypothetical protein
VQEGRPVAYFSWKLSHPWCSLVFSPLCSLVWEAISMVVPHVQKKMCWEKIICYKEISTRIFCPQQDEINAYRGTSTSICFLDYRNVLVLGME